MVNIGIMLFRIATNEMSSLKKCNPVNQIIVCRLSEHDTVQEMALHYACVLLVRPELE